MIRSALAKFLKMEEAQILSMEKTVAETMRYIAAIMLMEKLARTSVADILLLVTSVVVCGDVFCRRSNAQ